MRVTDGSVHVWRADLEAIGDRPEQLLCPAELARAARIVPAHKRFLWARSRGMLRALLGRYLDRDPLDLRFALGPHGKPTLSFGGSTRPEPTRPEATGDLRFNLSHSGGLALVAVTVGREVGVDVECARARYTAEFLRAWVAREAIIKCREANSPATLWTAAVDVGPRAAAAVAVEGGPCELCCWDWRG